jgi:ligand-binding sensor domain-containing protein
MNKFVVLCIAFLAVHFSYSQKYSFVSYSTEEGLPQSQVTSISQGKDGYLWVGTLGGLAKFNGNEFVTFSSNDGLWNNRVKTLTTFDGKLWVGHDGGISIIQGKNIQSIGFKGDDQSRHVSEIVKFKDDVIVCTAEGGIFQLQSNQLRKLQTDIDRIRSAYVHKGTLYLATRKGILYTTDLNEFKILEEVGENSFSGVTGNDSKLVFTMYASQAIVMELETKELKVYDFDSLRVSGCYLDREKQIWLNTGSGVIRINSNGEMLVIDDNTGLPVNMTSCFFQDNNSNIWIGSKGKGIFRFPGLSFQYYDHSSGFPTDLFLNGFQNKNGTYYFGTYEKGVLRKKPNGITETIDVGEDVIWASIQGIDGMNWFGAQNSLISIGENDEITIYDRSNGIPGSKICSFYRIDENSMYVGGNDGMAIYKDGKFKKLGKRGTEFLGTVRDIEIVDGVLYCVSNLGLFEYRNNNFFPVKGMDQVLYSVEADENGNLWLGAEEGLFRFKNGKRTNIELLDDPGSNYINFLNYRQDKLYVGTNNGLFVLDNLNGNTSFTRYGTGDGIPDLETNLNSGFFDKEDNFWFGTASGLVCYMPKVKRLTASNPKLNLKSILLNYQSFDYGTYSESVDANGVPKKLVLPFNKNNLTFNLDGVSLVHHRGLKYQFWLEGLSDDWSPLTDVPTITFTRLPAGNYTIKMRAVDIDGRQSEVISVPFVIEVAYYKSWWFITLCSLVIGGLILLVFRFRVRRINERNEKEKLVFKTRLLSLEQKSVNASMNRHFIFNALNSIQYFINTQDRLSANKYLTNFAQLIRKNLDTASADENMITLDEEIERLKLYLSLEAMRFKDRFDYKIETNDVDLESIRIPAMLMQPFIENSIIHGILPNEEVKGLISIEMAIKNGSLEIEILDNGIGVNQSISRKSDIDGDHRSQGMEITSKRIELIRKVSNNGISMEGPEEIIGSDSLIKGTRVLIKIPVADLDI